MTATTGKVCSTMAILGDFNSQALVIAEVSLLLPSSGRLAAWVFL